MARERPHGVTDAALAARDGTRTTSRGLWWTDGMETVVRVAGADLPATVSLPRGRVRAGVVALHGAEAGERSYFLYRHLAETLEGIGIAVLRYDRRPSPEGHDVPLRTQATDALVAARRLGELIGGAPVGLWGFSQGAWAAPLAVVTDPRAVSFLVCVSCCGVSPAEQMRFGCSRQLRAHGYGSADVDQLLSTRLAVEQYLRSGAGGEAAQERLDAAATRPWFPLAYLPRTLPPPGSWQDMDFDPRPVLAAIRCPVLAFYGETDEWMPIQESVAAWQAAGEHGALTDVTVVRLPGADHLPTHRGRPDAASIVPRYGEVLVDWLVSTAAPRG